MEWLVSLSIALPPVLMTNFFSYLEEETNLTPIAVEGKRIAIETANLRVTSAEAAQVVIREWHEWFSHYYPKVVRGEPMVTPLQEDGHDEPMLAGKGPDDA